ncbi:MAG: chemotaxis response regulator protein-glutamate methylesterase [candidate division Zixibacteria bacterium]|nr:chemotaxis response regulator protein-glutamate methylesterase [candidate division Zixibacteria bacterium]
MVVQTNQRQIRILVVDDSAFMRKALTMMLESDTGIKVVGTARDGQEGIEKVKQLKPDLVTMDIEMPRMDGLAALRVIMKENPVPVMMVSSLTTDGASATLDALEMGAVDFIPKQLSFVSLDIVKIKDELLVKIKDIVRRKSILMSRFRTARFTSLRDKNKPDGSTRDRRRPAGPPVPARKIASRQHHVGIIAVGSSTGGPPALQAVVPRLPRNLPVGMIIAQHMPAQFTKSLADRLNQLSQVSVKEADDNDWIEPGVVLIAPGGKQMTVRKVGGRSRVLISEKPDDTLYRPCVDVTMKSVADQFGGSSMGVILTGMGNNGVIGMQKMKSKGAIIVAQNEATCIVYGMPKAVIEAGISNHIAPIENIANEIVSYF